MRYYVDGYNLLFRILDSSEDLQVQRERILELLEEKLQKTGLDVILVFDGYHKGQIERTFQYTESLDILYTPKGQTADQYIIEEISYSTNPKILTIVTSDKKLSSQCRHMGAQTKTLSAFLQFISKKAKKTESSTNYHAAFSDTKKNIDRLLKIFEKRLTDESQNSDKF